MGGVAEMESGFRGAVAQRQQQRMAERGDTADAGRSMMEWALLVPEPKVGALNFEDFPYLVELYSDEVAELEEVVFVKSTQVGMSTQGWRWAGRRVQQFGDTSLYIFPTADHVTDFGDSRIEPSIEASDFLKAQIPGTYVRKKELKRIGLGWLFLRGSNSRAGAQSVDADSVTFDEYNELDPANVPQIERRLTGARQAGRIPRIRRMGIPTGPGEGIDTYLSDSDQRKWHVVCPKCGDEQPLDWWKNVVWTNPGVEGVQRPGHDEYRNAREIEKAWRVCRSCEASLEGVIRGGRWIATNPESKLRGYHVARLIVPRCDLIQMVRASRQTSPAQVIAFYNNDLGLAYAPTETSLDEASILAACSEGGEATQAVRLGPGIYRTAGIDVASERDLNVRVSELRADGARHALWIGTVGSFGEALDLIVRMRVTFFCIDSNPERRLARGMCKELPGRGCLVEYAGPEQRAFEYKEKENILRVNRTEAIDAMMDGIRLLRNIPLRKPPVGYVEQLMAPRRRATINKEEKVVRTYVSMGPDDYAHAEVFDLCAGEMLRMRHQAGLLMEDRPVSDEEIGFERTRLDDPFTVQRRGGDQFDGYDPGLGGEPVL